MRFIEECVSLIDDKEKGFPAGWLDNYDISDEDKATQSLQEIIPRASNLLKNCYEKLNYSVLSGEYIVGEKLINQIKELQQKTDGISADLGSYQYQNPVLNNIQGLILFGFSAPLKASLQDYLNLIYQVKRRLAHTGDTKILFEQFTIERPVNNLNQNLIDSHSPLNFFIINTQIATIDHQLSLDKTILQHLLTLHNRLNTNRKFDDYPYLEIVKDKCKYLIKKILCRFKKDSQNYLYAFDFEDRELNDEDLSLKYFDKLDKITRQHYDYIPTDSEYRKRTNAIYEKKRAKKPLSYHDYHHILKEYKEKENNLSQVENLYIDFTKKYSEEVTEESLSEFNKNALYTLRNYMLNNAFSMWLKNENTSVESAEGKLIEIEQLQQETQIRNYFPYVKMCSFLAQKAEHLLSRYESDYEQHKALLEKAKHHIDKLKHYREKAYKNFEWCKDRHFLAFQLPLHESYIESETLPCKLFLYSSFVLPVNYEEVALELKELTRRYNKLLTLKEVQENTRDHKEALSKLQSEMRRSDKRSIEIVGIFSAIVLFSSGSIQIFSIEGLTIKNALSFMLCFGFSLCWFVFFIWLITRESIRELSIIHKAAFALLSLATLFSLLFIIWKT